jgi:hypothetical protein
MKSSIPIRLRPRRSSPAASPATPASTSTSSPSPSSFPALRCDRHLTCYSTASLHGSPDTRALLDTFCTPASLLWDPRYTSQQRPSFTPPLRTWSSPAVRRRPRLIVTVDDDVDTDESIDEMDKRHPSSFQQLEKLGEGTYATVCFPCVVPRPAANQSRSSKDGTARPASWSLSRRSISTPRRALPAPPSARSPS